MILKTAYELRDMLIQKYDWREKIINNARRCLQWNIFWDDFFGDGSRGYDVWLYYDEKLKKFAVCDENKKTYPLIEYLIECQKNDEFSVLFGAVDRIQRLEKEIQWTDENIAEIEKCLNERDEGNETPLADAFLDFLENGGTI